MGRRLKLPVRLDVLNEGFQLRGAAELHLPGDMAVDVHGEGRSGMAQVLLEGLHVYAALDAGHGVGVPEIVHSGVGSPDLLDQPLKAVVHGPVGQIPAEGTGKHQACLLPLVAQQIPVVVLSLPLELEELCHRRGHGDYPLLVVLGGNELVRAAAPVLPLKLLLHQNGVVLEVHAVPGQAQQLALPHPREHGDLVQILVGMAGQQLQKGLDLLLSQRLDLLLHDPGQHAGLRGVEPDHAVLHRLLQGLVENPVHVLHGLGADGLLIRVRRLMQVVVIALDGGTVQLVQPDLPQVGVDVEPDALLIEPLGGGLDVHRVILQPGLHPVRHRHPPGVHKFVLIQSVEGLIQLFPDLLQGGARDGFLNLLPSFRIPARGVAGFKVHVLGAVLAHFASLSDAAASVCVFCSNMVLVWHNSDTSLQCHTVPTMTYLTISLPFLLGTVNFGRVMLTYCLQTRSVFLEEASKYPYVRTKRTPGGPVCVQIVRMYG